MDKDDNVIKYVSMRILLTSYFGEYITINYNIINENKTIRQKDQKNIEKYFSFYKYYSYYSVYEME